MLLFLASLCVLAVVTEQVPSVPCGTPTVQPHTKRIVGGTRATPGSWPWAVSFTDSLGFVQGVGTIIHKRVVVTTAQHFEGRHFSLFDLSLRHWRVYAGEYNISVRDPYEHYYRIARVILHPAYNATTLENDVALVLLTHDIQFNAHTRPCCLPDTTHTFTTGQVCYLPGWGRTIGTGDEQVMNQVAMPILPDANCSAVLHGYLPATELCAGYTNGGKDFCSGDIGSPLNCKNANGKWYIQGMASSGASCVKADKPGAFEDMGQYVDWIEMEMQTAKYPYEY